MVSLLSLLAACSEDFTTVAPDPVAAETVGETVREANLGGATYEPVSTGSYSLTLQWSEGVADYLEIRAYRFEADGSAWTGGTLTDTVALTGTGTTLALPPMAPRADRDADGAVHYVLGLRDADADGAPGEWVGAAPIELVWLSDADGTGGEAGWNLYDTGTGGWVAANVAPILDANLRGASDLALHGTASIATTGSTHLEIASADGAGAAFDTPVGPEWTLDIAGAPSTDIVDDANERGGWFYAVAYEDVDGDNRRAEESSVGTLCVGYNKAELSWFGAAMDLPSAIEMRDLGVRSGWDLRKITEDGDASPLGAEDYENLQILDECK